MSTIRAHVMMVKMATAPILAMNILHGLKVQKVRAESTFLSCWEPTTMTTLSTTDFLGSYAFCDENRRKIRRGIAQALVSGIGLFPGEPDLYQDIPARRCLQEGFQRQYPAPDQLHLRFQGQQSRGNVGEAEPAKHAAPQGGAVPELHPTIWPNARVKNRPKYLSRTGLVSICRRVVMQPISIQSPAASILSRPRPGQVNARVILLPAHAHPEQAPQDHVLLVCVQQPIRLLQAPGRNIFLEFKQRVSSLFQIYTTRIKIPQAGRYF